jgi:hypothetical protein
LAKRSPLPDTRKKKLKQFQSETERTFGSNPMKGVPMSQITQLTSPAAQSMPNQGSIGSGAVLVMAAALMRAVGRQIDNTNVGSAINKAISNVLNENGFPDPDGPEQHGPGSPVERLATAAELLQAAAQLPSGQVQKALVGTAKRLMGVT